MQARGKEAIVTGFYHHGYEEPLLMLMRRRGVHSGLVVKVGIESIKLYLRNHMLLTGCFLSSLVYA